MLLDFNIDKAIAATAYLLEQEGGSDDMFPLIKKLYYADRSALIAWGDSITGDRLASLKKGPIVSMIYNLMKGEGREENQILWDNAITREQPHTIRIRKEVNRGVLSQREMEELEKSRVVINGIRGETIADWLHRNCPEWTDPGDSSSPIDPSTILRLANKNEEEIRSVEEANDEIRFVKSLLDVR